MASIALNGRALEVLEIDGDRSLPALVLLHEGLGSVGLWRRFPQDLAAATGARVIAYSRFGHGASDPPPAPRTPRFMHEEADDVLPGVLEAFDAQDAVLVGHSDGASIALIYAGRHAPRGVVAIAPHVFVEQICLTEIQKAKEAYESGELRERLAKHHEHVDAAFYGWNSVWLHPDFPRWRLDDRLDAITAPLCLIQGVEDQYGTMAQLDVIQQHVGSAIVERHELACRHAPPLEAPEATIAAIQAFVARLSSSAK